MSEIYECSVGDKKISIEVGKLAEQANGAVTVRCGDTVVLVTACSTEESREGVDFFPLTIDYEERLYAVGRIPGGFIRREGRATQEATLTARLVDRCLRPLFPKGLRNEVQVIVTVLAVDHENDPDVLALIGASTALTISDIPFEGPVGAVHVGHIDGRLRVNPTLTEIMANPLDLVVASTKDAVVMIEAGAQEVSEGVVFDGIKFAHEQNQEIIRLQQRMRDTIGKQKMAFKPVEIKPEVVSSVAAAIDNEAMERALGLKDKKEGGRLLDQLRKETALKLGESVSANDLAAVFDSKVKSKVRSRIIDRNERPDGRGINEIRPIEAEVGFLPRAHGSGLFKRGMTQVLTIATLGSASQAQKLDGLGLEEHKRFMHHYNFPPFSGGEVKRVGTPGRREIGHGALAERGLLPVVPKENEFSYTIRLVSEVLSSNGSTSMASVCASTLALMDAGVPIRAPVAGIAIGLVTANDGRFIVLTDIEGMEDAYGDMDFKVAGTAKGITAIQVDTKLKGLSFDVILQALQKAQQAREQILEKMTQVISTSRSEVSRYAPRMYKMHINPSKIGAVIGPGGKTIRAIVEETKATIDIEDDGTVMIGATSELSAQKAMKRVGDLTEEIEVGRIYTGKVSRLLNYGVMVEIMPGKEGMVHISELADYRVASVEDVVKIGDEIMVKVVEVDRLGRVNLSRKAVYEGQAGAGDVKPGESQGGRPESHGGRPPPRPISRLHPPRR